MFVELLGSPAVEATTAAKLPRGRHRLTRDEVLASQRGRMLAAMADVVGEKGYAAAAVADVIERAGVSRATFYEHFSNKEDCFIAAYDAGVEAITAVMREALADGSGDPLDRLDRAIGAYLQALASQPGFARASLIESYAAGPRAIERRAELLQDFVAVVTETLGVRSKDDRFACETVVAAVSSMVTMRVGAGRIDELSELRGPIMKLARRWFER
jgi:AcrR family transcriptional regulator